MKKSEVAALRTASTYTFWALWDSGGLATDAGALNTITLELPPAEEVVVDESVEEPEKKWYESKIA